MPTQTEIKTHLASAHKALTRAAATAQLVEFYLAKLAR